MEKKTKSNFSQFKFIPADDLNNMDFLPSKQIDGVTEFSQSRQFTKNINVLETENNNQAEILVKLKNIEEILTKIYELLNLENSTSDDNAKLPEVTSTVSWRNKIFKNINRN